MILSHTPGGRNGDDAKDHHRYRPAHDSIKAQIEDRGFTNDGEYILDLIRRDQARYSEINAIRGELIKGEQSGEQQPFDSDLFKQEMAAKHARKAR